MNTKPITRLLAVLIIPAVVAGFSMDAQATPFPLEEKLNQCEIAFDKARSKTMSQGEAANARREHMTLVTEILKELNKRNAAIDATSGKSLSPQEILDNLRVMGRLLEMMAIQQQGTLGWPYMY